MFQELFIKCIVFLWRLIKIKLFFIFEVPIRIFFIKMLFKPLFKNVIKYFLKKHCQHVFNILQEKISIPFCSKKQISKK